MAVWMATAHKDLASKGTAVIFPISGFIALGLVSLAPRRLVATVAI